MNGTATAYVTIENRDDKLTQALWVGYIRSVRVLLRDHSHGQIHAEWFSAPDSQRQNACWYVEIARDQLLVIREGLGFRANLYGQESISFAAVSDIDFIRPRGSSLAFGAALPEKGEPDATRPVEAEPSR